MDDLIRGREVFRQIQIRQRPLTLGTLILDLLASPHVCFRALYNMSVEVRFLIFVVREPSLNLSLRRGIETRNFLRHIDSFGPLVTRGTRRIYDATKADMFEGLKSGIDTEKA